jgi:DeoR/GlpR family transcriptional regulator of sugar metabolism
MNAFDRRSEIVKYLQENERASTRLLSDLFDVSEVTIRHDLNALGTRGWIERVHGGAELVRRLQYEQSFSERESLNSSAKKRIARTAAKLVQPGNTILMDSSTTVFQLALLLRDAADLRVVTNNLRIVSVLSPNKEIEVVVIGGIVREETASIVGPPAEEMVSKWHGELGFFGAAGFTAKRGLTDVDIREATVKRAMTAAVDTVNVLLDSSKFGKQAFSTFAGLEEIDRLISDEPLTAEYADLCEQYEISYQIA